MKPALAAGGRLACRRLGEGLAVLLAVSLLTFALLSATAGDAATAIALKRDGTATPGAVASIRAELGLDLPAPVRYLHGLVGLLHGDLGASLRTGRDVGAEVTDRIGPTVTLASTGALLAVVLGLGAAVLAAASTGRLARALLVVPVRAGSVALLSLPSFALAYVGVLAFSLRLRVLPTQGMAGWPSLVLPAAVIGLPLAAAVARVAEARLRATLAEPFVVTARARGLSPVRVLLTVALPNAAAPLLVVVGNQVGYAVSGTLVAETVFGWPGLGSYLVEALRFRDWYPLQAAVLLIAGAAVLTRGTAGSLAALVDARAGSSRAT